MNWSKASDLDINRRIAEIERMRFTVELGRVITPGRFKAFSPCTDWYQAGPLILKHEVDVHFFVDENNLHEMGANAEVVECEAISPNQETIRYRSLKTEALRAAMICICIAHE